MDLGLAALHAAIEGFCGTLPLSASGHRLAAGIWLGEGRDRVAWTAVAQLGCAVALLVVTRARLGTAFAEGIRGIARPAVLHEAAGRDAVVLTIAALVGAVIHQLAGSFTSRFNEVPVVAGAGLLLSATALASTLAAPAPEKLGPSVPGAVLVGIAFGLAVVPGLTAVGAAFVVARWLGVTTWRAAEMALVVSIPTLAVGAIRQLLVEGARLAAADVAIATTVAFATALVGASLWQAICERRRTAWLGLWLVPMALALIGYGRALPHPTDELAIPGAPTGSGAAGGQPP